MHFLLTTTLFFLAFLLLGILIQRIHRRRVNTAVREVFRILKECDAELSAVKAQLAQERRELKHFAERHQNLLTNAQRTVRNVIARKNYEMQHLRLSRSKLIEETNKLRAYNSTQCARLEALREDRMKLVEETNALRARIYVQSLLLERRNKRAKKKTS